MSRWGGVCLVLLLAALGAWYWLSKPAPGPAPQNPTAALTLAAPPPSSSSPTDSPPAPGPARTVQAAAAEGPLASEQPGEAVSAVTAPAGAPANITDPSGIAPLTALENMRTTIRQYGSMFGGNPVGTNPEIARQLNGENPKQARFLDSVAAVRTNEAGELVDSWGTPYFFHQLSGKETEIRSAGPDKIMWTSDDLVTR